LIGHTCESLGKKLGVSKVQYWYIEKGERKLSYELALRISIILDTTTDELFLEYFTDKK